MEGLEKSVEATREPSFLLAVPEKRLLRGSRPGCRAGSCPTT